MSSSNTETIIDTSKDQVIAEFIHNLNMIKLNHLTEKLYHVDMDSAEAYQTLGELKNTIAELIVSNRGGEKGIHGFIAEAAEVAFENAERHIQGLEGDAIWKNDNDQVIDIIRNGTGFQMKFSQANYSILKIKEHLDKHPDFIKNGNRYMIPKDYYDKVVKILKMTDSDVKKLSNSIKTEYTKAEAEYVRRFFSESGLSIERDFEPAKIKYAEAQKGNIYKTIDKETNYVNDIAENRKEEIRSNYQDTKVTIKEGIKIAGASAALEGGTAFFVQMNRKLKKKKIEDFTEKDWKEVGINVGMETAKGGIRGSTIYLMTNYTKTPANMASAAVTAAFGMASQYAAFRQGKISKNDLMANSMTICLDTTVSALSSTLGQILIPVPVLGTVIGNAVGRTMFSIAKDTSCEEEIRIIEDYIRELGKLQSQYDATVCEINEKLKKFDALIDRAFDEDDETAFAASIELARFGGVDEDKILKTKENIDKYFLE